MATKVKAIRHPKKRQAFVQAKALAIKELWVTSTMVDKIEYDPNLEILVIQYKGSGKRYAYKNVPESVFRALKRTPSVGKYVCKYIKDAYLVVGPL